MENKCFFCEQLKKDKFVYDNDSFYVRFDDFPVSKGHCNIVLKRHKSSLFDLTREEHMDLKDALDITKQFLDEEYNPDSYNLGVNDGEAAGQTIPHLHVHIIPRYHGDIPNPKGGVRNILPGGDYTKK